ncbi:MAG: pirin family protein [Chloroflexota bacterium]
MLRSVTNTITAPDTPEGVGALVKRALPNRVTGTLDPFVLLDEFFVEPPAEFSEHPHRGFEIVTYVLTGSFRHKDTMGNDSTIPAGGLQKITAGAGIAHAELPMTQGMNHGLQLWINLPRALKQIPPAYQGIEPDQIPIHSGDGFRVRTIIGEGSPVSLRTPVLYLDIDLDAGATWEGTVPSDFAGLIYVLKGRGQVGDGQAAAKPAQMLALGEGDTVRVTAGPAEGMRFALIAGKPHGEPMRLRGPFVD